VRFDRVSVDLRLFHPLLQPGSLEKGKIADIVVLRGNVTKQRDFRHVLLVMRAGRVSVTMHPSSSSSNAKST
jgi:cytosine/adenosine deaminase-related metal-dependent hydrolase